MNDLDALSRRVAELVGFELDQPPAPVSPIWYDPEGNTSNPPDYARDPAACERELLPDGVAANIYWTNRRVSIHWFAESKQTARGSGQTIAEAICQAYVAMREANDDT